MTVYLTRRETFNAAHRLWVDAWTEEENFRVFGKCANPYYHGHNYQLFVTVKGKPDPVTGFLMDAKELSNLIKKQVTDIIDHTNLSAQASFLPVGLQPSTENLAIYIWPQLVPHLPQGVNLHQIRVWETENIYCDFFGED